MRWMKLEPIIQSEVSQKDKDQYSIVMHIYGILKDGNDNPICKTEKETQMYRTDFWTLWEKARVGCSERIALKQVYYQGWKRSPAQVGCMRQVLRAGALGRPRGIGWGGRREGGSGWLTHVNPWLIHVNVWQKPLQYCKVISLQLIKINEKKRVNQHRKLHFCFILRSCHSHPILHPEYWCSILLTHCIPSCKCMLTYRSGFGQVYRKTNFSQI